MGGKGSGRKPTKRLTTEFERVTIRSVTDFSKAHCQYARWHQWRVGLALTLHEFVFKNGVSRTRIEGFLICPECHTRKKVLYAERDRSRLACAECLGALHPSQRPSATKPPPAPVVETKIEIKTHNVAGLELLPVETVREAFRLARESSKKC